MEKVKSKVLREILAARRSRFNAAFAMARQVKINLNPDTFTHYFLLFAEQLIAEYKATDRAPLEKMIVELYDAVLELCVKDLLGNRGKYPFFENALSTLIDHFVRNVSAEPGIFFALMANILVKCAESGEQCVDRWLRLIIQADDGNGLDSLLECGLVCAWRCGMAQYREAALEYAGAIHPSLFSVIFDLGERQLDRKQQEIVISGMKKNPWILPVDILEPSEKNQPEIRIVGNFSGFGGQFENPPRIFTDGEILVAYDGERFLQLYADIYGQELVQIEQVKKPRKNKPDKDFHVDNTGNLVFRDARFPLPGKSRLRISVQARAGATLCFTTTNSHKLFVLGVPVY